MAKLIMYLISSSSSSSRLLQCSPVSPATAALCAGALISELLTRMVRGTASREMQRPGPRFSPRKMSIYSFRKAVLAVAILLATNVFSERTNGNVSTSFVDSCWPGVTWDEFGIKQEDAIRAQLNRKLIGPAHPVARRMA
jgi:hypothetical protein